MLKRFAVPGLLAIAVFAAGCLQKDAVHTLYLSPDGALKWTVDESIFYSDESDEWMAAAEQALEGAE